VKKILFVVMLIAVFSFAAMAQDAKVPSLVANHNGEATAHGPSSVTWGLPSVPAGKSILFYGGDVNPNDPNVQGFANGNTVLTPNVTTYGSVTAPKSGKITTSAVFFNNEATQTGNIYDPATATYDIETNVKDGVGATELTHGSGKQTAVATGRLPFGLTEMTDTVSFSSVLTAKDGTTYVINESPQCTDTSNATCTEQFFFSNTTQQTNSVNGSAQPAGQLWFNSTFFGFTWTNWCDAALGQNSAQCARGSWGLLH
jgi:hypothetical protein